MLQFIYDSHKYLKDDVILKLISLSYNSLVINEL